MELRRLDNIDVLCTSLPAMVEFYEETLGLRFSLPYERAQGWAGFQAGDVVIYLIEVPPRERPPRRTPATGDSPPGLDSIAFEVDDLEEAIAVLSDGGVEWATEVVESPWYRYRGFYDPEGNLLYVTKPQIVRGAAASLP